MLSLKIGKKKVSSEFSLWKLHSYFFKDFFGRKWQKSKFKNVFECLFLPRKFKCLFWKIIVPRYARNFFKWFCCWFLCFKSLKLAYFSFQKPVWTSWNIFWGKNIKYVVVQQGISTPQNWILVDEEDDVNCVLQKNHVDQKILWLWSKNTLEVLTSLVLCPWNGSSKSVWTEDWSYPLYLSGQ